MSKRLHSATLVPNPFVKKRNLAWTLIDNPSSLREHQDDSKCKLTGEQCSLSTASGAAVDSGRSRTTDHLSYFTKLLSSRVVPDPIHRPPLSIEDYSNLYRASVDNPQGAHFVIHQHDHPVAGTHYDLRLQINETSSASWAIMYGLPGDANSRRGNRNATETRIHCLWNHLVETGSPSTGSLIIWDTGTYTVLPRRSKHSPSHDPSSQSSSPPQSPSTPPTQQQLLHTAFQSRKIRLQLHGSKLPDPYVLNLRLTKPEDAAGRLRSSRAPRYRRGVRGRPQEPASRETSSSSSDSEQPGQDARSDSEEDHGEKDAGGGDGVQDPHVTSATERELLELEDHQVRLTNAYPGAENTIGSVHQRSWYLSLDKEGSGFVKRKGGKSHRWEWSQEAKPSKGDEQGSGTGKRLGWPFYVRGVEVERSVITGRKGEHVLRDEGVKGFVGRKGWKPVLA